MTIQVQRFILEIQTWRTTHMAKTFLEAQLIAEKTPWGAAIEDDQWEAFEQVGMALAGEIGKWTDVVLCVNQSRQVILRSQRQQHDPRGYLFVNICPDKVVFDCRAYLPLQGTFVFGAVPYRSLLDSVKGIHAK